MASETSVNERFCGFVPLEHALAPERGNSPRSRRLRAKQRVRIVRARKRRTSADYFVLRRRLRSSHVTIVRVTVEENEWSNGRRSIATVPIKVEYAVEKTAKKKIVAI
jgi:hypothetical protein